MSAHAAFLGDAIAALGEHVELGILCEHFHAHLRPRLLPGLVQQSALERREPPLGRTDHVLHGRIACAHLAEYLLGGDGPIRQPYPPRLTCWRSMRARCGKQSADRDRPRSEKQGSMLGWVENIGSIAKIEQGA